MNQSQVRDENRIWALVAYALAPLGSLLALLAAGDDPALKRHAVQALLAGIVAAVASTVLGLIPALSCVALPLAAAFWLYLIYCGVRAYRGQDVQIPLISGIAA